MRDVKRHSASEKASVRSDTQSHDIGDIWARQERERQATIQAAARFQSARERARHEYGVVGVATRYIKFWYRKTRVVLFGRRAKTPTAAPKPAQIQTRHTAIRITTAPAPVNQRPAAPSQPTTVEINIGLPSLSKLVPDIKKARKQLKTPRKVFIRGGIVVVIAIAAYGGYYYLLSPKSNVNNQDVAGLATGAPNYKTILPAGKNIESLGGWTRVSPPDRNPVFAYIDKIGNTQINVSQQPIPEEFKHDVNAETEKLATGYKATEKVTAGNTIAYIGNSVKGPQSVIFNKDGVLILIKSTVKIDNNQWAEYINSLR